MRKLLGNFHLSIYNFTTVRFLLFLAGVALLYRFVPRSWRAPVLLIASYFLYFDWNHRMMFLLLLSTVATYAAARAIEARREAGSNRLILLLLVAGLVSILAFFKAPAVVHDFVRHAIDHPYLDLTIPLGISYYTFKLLSYLIDVYSGKSSAERRFIPFAAYIAFFPQIVAGPIQRPEDFLPQLEGAAPAHFRVVLLGVQRILLGFFKKFVVADHLGLLVNFIYGHLYGHGTPLLLGFYGYPLQLYADFSGLADIAIGAAWLLGIKSPENFNAPFAASSLTDYWRRWHITLTGWLTDYVFMPLRMSTREWGNLGLVLSLFANMALIGVWHGFRWTFLAFGLVHAFYLSVEALTARARKRYFKQNPGFDRLANWLAPVVTFHLTAIAFVLFRAETVGAACYYLAHLFQGIPNVSPEFQTFWHYLGLTVLSGFWGFALAEMGDYWRRQDKAGQIVFTLPRWARWSVYSCTATSFLILLILVYASGQSSTPFLYAVF